jgi:hypothetical protein
MPDAHCSTWRVKAHMYLCKPLKKRRVISLPPCLSSWLRGNNVRCLCACFLSHPFRNSSCIAVSQRVRLQPAHLRSRFTCPYGSSVCCISLICLPTLSNSELELHSPSSKRNTTETRKTRGLSGAFSLCICYLKLVCSSFSMKNTRLPYKVLVKATMCLHKCTQMSVVPVSFWLFFFCFHLQLRKGREEITSLCLPAVQTTRSRTRWCVLHLCMARERGNDGIDGGRQSVWLCSLFHTATATVPFLLPPFFYPYAVN